MFRVVRIVVFISFCSGIVSGQKALKLPRSFLPYFGQETIWVPSKAKHVLSLPSVDTVSFNHPTYVTICDSALTPEYQLAEPIYFHVGSNSGVETNRQFVNISSGFLDIDSLVYWSFERLERSTFYGLDAALITIKAPNFLPRFPGSFFIHEIDLNSKSVVGSNEFEYRWDELTEQLEVVDLISVDNRNSIALITVSQLNRGKSSLLVIIDSLYQAKKTIEIPNFSAAGFIRFENQLLIQGYEALAPLRRLYLYVQDDYEIPFGLTHQLISDVQWELNAYERNSNELIISESMNFDQPNRFVLNHYFDSDFNFIKSVAFNGLGHYKPFGQDSFMFTTLHNPLSIGYLGITRNDDFQGTDITACVVWDTVGINSLELDSPWTYAQPPEPIFHQIELEPVNRNLDTTFQLSLPAIRPNLDTVCSRSTELFTVESLFELDSLSIAAVSADGVATSAPDSLEYVFPDVDYVDLALRYNLGPCLIENVDRVFVKPTPLANLPDTSLLCPGQSSITIDNAASDWSIAWSTGAIGASTMINDAGIYSAIVAEGNCSDTFATQALFFEEQYPDAGFSIGMDTLLCNRDFPFQPAFSLSPPDLRPQLLGSAGFSTLIPQAGFYVFQVEIEGCSLLDSLLVRQEDCSLKAYLPNAFSPNGDGINDTWFPLGNDFEVETIEIFDRWGERVFSGNTPWNGRHRGEPLNAQLLVVKTHIKNLKTNERELLVTELNLVR